jgi:hypothetical protein
MHVGRTGRDSALLRRQSADGRRKAAWNLVLEVFGVFDHSTEHATDLFVAAT